MSRWPLLSLVTFLPLLGAAFILIARGEEKVVARNARYIALWTSLIVFALSILLWVWFDPDTAEFQFVEQAKWVTLGGFTISYHHGIDGISLFFILLSTLLTLLSVVSAWEVIQVRVKEFMVAFLVLETLMVGIFCALDFVLFYVFFEGVLIPMFLIIGVWGGENRVYSAFKFFLYTLARLGVDAARRAGASTSRPARRTSSYALITAKSFPPACRNGCGSPFSPRSRSRCRCGRCTLGCPTRMSRRRRRAR